MSQSYAKSPAAERKFTTREMVLRQQRLLLQEMLLEPMTIKNSTALPRQLCRWKWD